MLTHYQTLEVSRSADLGAIKKAYYRISLLCHPDKTVRLPDAERVRREHLFRLANVAFEILSDPQKRKAYDQNIRLEQSRPTTRPAPNHQPPDGDCRRGKDAPPRSNTAYPGDDQDTQSSRRIQRALSSAHRFMASTLGKAPDFQWYHCQLNEYNKDTTLTYNNWLGWNFSISLASHFKVIAKPDIPQKPVPESIVIRLPLLRKGDNVPRTTDNVCIDLRGVPGDKYIIVCSALIESQAAGLELIVEFVIAHETAQTTVQGPTVWKWAYSIDHEPLMADTQARVTNMLLFPYLPFMAIAPHGGMPTPPYPGESPMRELLMQFPEMKIEESAPDIYCVQEEQQGKTMWRLTTVGSI